MESPKSVSCESDLLRSSTFDISSMNVAIVAETFAKQATELTGKLINCLNFLHIANLRNAKQNIDEKY